MKNRLSRYYNTEISYLDDIDEFFTWQISHDSSIISIGQEVKNILGFDTKELKNKNIKDLMVGFSGQKFQENIFKSNENNMRNYHEDILCNTKRGENIMLCFCVIPIINDNDDLIGFEGIAYKK